MISDSESSQSQTEVSPMSFHLSMIVALMCSACLIAAEVPEDWREYDDLEADALCGYVERGLHGDLSELVYIMEVYRGRVDRAVMNPKAEQSDSTAATLTRAHACVSSIMRAYNADTAVAKAVRDKDLASLRKTFSAIMAAAAPLDVELPEQRDDELPVGEPARAQPASEGEPIKDAGVVAAVKTALMGFDQLLADANYRRFLEASRRVPENFSKWDDAEREVRARRDAIRTQLAYALAHEADWRLVNASLVHVPVAGVDAEGDHTMVLAKFAAGEGYKILGFKH